MIEYSPLRENWFYSRVHIPNLEIIQSEMLACCESTTHKKVAYNSQYVNIFKKDMDQSMYPATIEYLKSVGIYEKFFRILFTQSKPTVTVDTEKTTDKPAVHIDTIDPYRCQFSLNIPLEYCEKTYTGFYKTSHPELLKPAFAENDYRHAGNFAWMPAEFAEEITRAEVYGPMLVNTTVLHRAISDEPRRKICCFRFSPELDYDDLINIGIENPFIQEDNYG